MERLHTTVEQLRAIVLSFHERYPLQVCLGTTGCCKNYLDLRASKSVSSTWESSLIRTTGADFSDNSSARVENILCTQEYDNSGRERKKEGENEREREKELEYDSHQIVWCLSRTHTAANCYLCCCRFSCCSYIHSRNESTCNHDHDDQHHHPGEAVIKETEL